MTAVGHVWLVGSGPGDPGLLTVAGLRALRAADVVLYDRLAPAALLEETRAGCELVNVGKAAGDHTMSQDDINTMLIERGRAGQRVVRLKGGDPYVFGRGGEEALALVGAGVPCTVIPGITSGIGGLAAAGVPVTHRAVATSFAVVTGHEDPTKPAEGVDWSRLATAVDTIVVLMGVGRLEGIATAMIEAGRSAETPAALVQQATLPQQRSVTATLGTIAEVARDAGIRAPALFVVGEVAGLQAALDPRHLAPLAGMRVLVTRTRQQASTLVEALQLEGAHPIELPAIEIQRRVDQARLNVTIEALRMGWTQWTVFTSSNAVEVFLDALIEAGSDSRILATTRIAAIGPATQAALAARSLRADLVANDATGEGMLAALLESVGHGERVLLPRAEGARDVLPEGLRAQRIEVDELTLYLAAPPADPPAEVLDAVRNGQIDIVTFTSSSTVKNLARLLDGDLSPLRDTLVACIGPATADASREAGLEPTVVAEEHTIEGLMAALRTHLLRPISSVASATSNEGNA